VVVTENEWEGLKMGSRSRGWTAEGEMGGMGGGGLKHAAVMHCRRVPLVERIVFVISSNNLEN
jgi:hypothetical protein